LITEPQLLTTGPTAITPFTPLSDMQINRHEIGVNSTETYLDEQLDITARFQTGSLRHTLVTGIEAGRETSDPYRPNFTALSTSLLNPDPYESLNPNPTVLSNVRDTAVSIGAYVVDTVSVGRHLDLTGGVRFDRFDDNYTRRSRPPRISIAWMKSRPGGAPLSINRSRMAAFISMQARRSILPPKRSR
jgi:catecholate siderophore receptor